LDKGKSKYSIIYRETKFSHTTIQSVLKYLVKKEFIKKTTRNKLSTYYEITKKGKIFFEKLGELEILLR